MHDWLWSARSNELLLRCTGANTSTAGLCPENTDGSPGNASSLQLHADAYNQISCNRDFCLLTLWEGREHSSGQSHRFRNWRMASPLSSSRKATVQCLSRLLKKACSEAGTAPYISKRTVDRCLLCLNFLSERAPWMHSEWRRGAVRRATGNLNLKKAALLA